MPGHDTIVVGASVGGVEALSQLAKGLPPGLAAAIFVVCHFPTDSRSVLPEILSRSGPLLAMHPRDGQMILPGQIYVAPPDYHLLVEPGRVRLGHGPRENHSRPAIDPLFRSAARAYGPRVIGVILSGALSDGVAGLMAVRAAGGLGVVQDPSDAVMATMPRTARDIAGADHVVPLRDIGPLLVSLVQRSASQAGGSDMSDPLEKMPEVMNHDMTAQSRGERRGTISTFTCPECGGTLWQADQAELARFRCHVGHAYYGEKLLAEQSEALEAALWTAVRTFKEKTVLARQLAATERARANTTAAERFEEQARQAEEYGQLIQRMLEGNNKPPQPEVDLVRK